MLGLAIGESAAAPGSAVPRRTDKLVQAEPVTQRVQLPHPAPRAAVQSGDQLAGYRDIAHLCGEPIGHIQMGVALLKGSHAACGMVLSA